MKIGRMFGVDNKKIARVLNNLIYKTFNKKHQRPPTDLLSWLTMEKCLVLKILFALGFRHKESAQIFNYSLYYIRELKIRKNELQYLHKPNLFLFLNENVDQAGRGRYRVRMIDRDFKYLRLANRQGSHTFGTEQLKNKMNFHSFNKYENQ